MSGPPGHGPTPGRINSVYATNAPPQIRQVDHTPQQPSAGQSAVITAKVTDPDGVVSVRLAYQIVAPGAYIPAFLAKPTSQLLASPTAPLEPNPAFENPAYWISVTMLDDGSGADAKAGDGIYTVMLPGQTNRTLVRYRITVEDTLGHSVRIPYADDLSLNFASASTETAKSCGCGCNGAKGGCGDTSSETTANLMPTASVSATADVIIAKHASAPTGRALARARRSALSQDGKSGLKRVAQATKIAASMPTQDWEAAISKGATSRQVAMQRRFVQSLTGNTKPASEKRPSSGRMRARMETPARAKVEEGHTLSGQSVTGTMVERSKKVTGNEPGSCRAITGTEYIGAEQYDAHCSKRSAPAPSKTSVSQTGREHTVTGTSVSRFGKVTGNEPGSCRAITGTE